MHSILGNRMVYQQGMACTSTVELQEQPLFDPPGSSTRSVFFRVVLVMLVLEALFAVVNQQSGSYIIFQSKQMPNINMLLDITIENATPIIADVVSVKSSSVDTATAEVDSTAPLIAVINKDRNYTILLNEHMPNMDVLRDNTIKNASLPTIADSVSDKTPFAATPFSEVASTAPHFSRIR